VQSLSEARVSTIINVIAGAKQRPSDSSKLAQSREVITEQHINTRKKKQG